MTNEAKRALEILQTGRKYKEDVRKIKLQYPLIDKDDPMSPVNDSTCALWQPYIDRYSKQGLILAEYCRENPSIKAEFEGEIKKLNAKIKAEKEKYFKDNKSKIDNINERIADAKRLADKRDKVENVVNFIMSALIGLWIVAYIVLLIALPTVSTFHKLLMEGVLLFGVAPVVGLIFLRILVNNKVEDWAGSASCLLKSVKEEYEDVEKAAEDKVAHLKAQLTDYNLIIGIITGKALPLL